MEIIFRSFETFIGTIILIILVGGFILDVLQEIRKFKK